MTFKTIEKDWYNRTLEMYMIETHGSPELLKQYDNSLYNEVRKKMCELSLKKFMDGINPEKQINIINENNELFNKYIKSLK